MLLTNDGVLPLGRRRRVDRGDRPERRHAPATSSATTPTRRTSSRCRTCSTAGGAVSSDSRRRVGGDRSGGDRLRRRCSTRCARALGASVSFAPGCDVDWRVRRRLRRGGRAGRRRRRRGPGDGRQVRPHRGLHERRVPRPCLARPSGRAGGARPRGARDRDAGRARARGGTPVGERVAARALRGRAAGLASRARRAPSAIADVLSGDANPGGKLPISYPRAVGQMPVFYAHKVSGGRSHWNGDYVDESGERRSTRSATASATRRFELSELRIAEHDGAVGRRDRRRRAGDEHRRARRRRGRPAVRRATRRRASRGRCSS